ncbi:MAG: hypothetical protein ACE15F_16770 [bacterium]
MEIAKDVMNAKDVISGMVAWASRGMDFQPVELVRGREGHAAY